MKALKPLFFILLFDLYSCFKTSRSVLVSVRPSSHFSTPVGLLNRIKDKSKTFEPQKIKFLKKGELFNLQCDRPGGNSILSLYYQPTLENISGKEQLFQIWGQNPYGSRKSLKKSSSGHGGDSDVGDKVMLAIL